MRTINVLLPEFREPTFRTAEEAIADGDRRSRSEVALKIRGHKIADVRWNASEFFAILDGQPGGFRIRRQEDVLAAELTQEVPASLLAAPTAHDREVIVLHYTKSGREVEWNRAELAASLKGKTIQALTMGVAVCFLTLRESLVVFFSLLICQDSQHTVLHWEKSQ
jgi:hypothetical protein